MERAALNSALEKLRRPDFKQTVAEAVADALKAQVPVSVSTQVPVSVSARHIHLSAAHLEALFGKGSSLTVMKAISQPGQFAAHQQVSLETPKGRIDRVRVLGPLRSQTQVELSRSDCRALGLPAMVRPSGKLDGTPGLTIIGPMGRIHLDGGVIVPDRHLHLSPQEAKHFGVTEGQVVGIEIESPRGGRLDHVTIRVSERYRMDCHVDTDDANAFFMEAGTLGRIVV